ncbi:DUF3284 domain-containing protein [Isobaculum melis]|uniref:DUF3284 domain-containing protein n=1 Tax=Isobaculum melis TaxID=142588 RepID=A0A1H9TZ15_9LACT|nr:DUF3284 domain-containing protein [Isobaculum melis]SES02167.1 protein of unknown function [Isobaculum melis]
MKVTEKLAISAEDFFKCMIESAAHDVKEHTGKTLTRNQLAGFEYKKVLGQKQSARLKITKIVDNQTYQFVTKTGLNEFEVTYSIQALDANHCEVTYLENVVSHGKMRTLNDKIVGGFVGFFRKKNVKRLLHAIEQTAVQA